MFEAWTQLRSVLKRCGIDRAVGYSLLSRGWGTCAGVCNLYFVSTFLRADEQGFFYTFGSIIALNFLIELGLSNVLMQCCSHEMADLWWTPKGTVEGHRRAKCRVG
jgi:hypothetical protein